MVINHVRHEFNVDIQTEMFELIKHLANCEPFEVDGLKARANINRVITCWENSHWHKTNIHKIYQLSY